MVVIKLGHPFAIYDDFDTLLEQIAGCENKLKKSFNMIGNKHTPCGFSTSVRFAYSNDKNHEINFLIVKIAWKYAATN